MVNQSSVFLEKTYNMYIHTDVHNLLVFLPIVFMSILKYNLWTYRPGVEILWQLVIDAFAEIDYRFNIDWDWRY